MWVVAGLTFASGPVVASRMAETTGRCGLAKSTRINIPDARRPHGRGAERRSRLRVRGQQQNALLESSGRRRQWPRFAGIADDARAAGLIECEGGRVQRPPRR
jgi:hypothetical protein